MGEILAVGITHYPPLAGSDETMAWILKRMLQNPHLPEKFRSVQTWPEAMRAEWGNDEGTSAARAHRERLLRSLRKTRAQIDEFRPDFIVVWGDDQYENFREDVIPPYCIYAHESFEFAPPKQNVWNDGPDKTFHAAGNVAAAKYLAGGLIEAGFDTAYSYKPLHHPLGHAFPPAPTPRRLFDLGAATARIFAQSPWRVALMASSGWSHAFLTAKNNFLYPDTAADRTLFEALRAGNFDAWRNYPAASVEASGQQEILNWMCLAGVLAELKRKPAETEFIDTWIFNSSKCFLTAPPPR